MECAKCKGQDVSTRFVPKCNKTEQAILIYLAVALECDQPVLESIFLTSFASISTGKGKWKSQNKWICRLSSKIIQRMASEFPDAEVLPESVSDSAPSVKKCHVRKIDQNVRFRWKIGNWGFFIQFDWNHQIGFGVMFFNALVHYFGFNDNNDSRFLRDNLKGKRIGYLYFDRFIDENFKQIKTMIGYKHPS